MNAENPVQIDLFGVSATRTKDTRLAEHIGGSARVLLRPSMTQRYKMGGWARRRHAEAADGRRRFDHSNVSVSGSVRHAYWPR